MRKLYGLKWKFHFMVWRSPARPSQLPDWYSSGVLAFLFLRRINPLHLEGLRDAVIGQPRPSWWPVSGRHPLDTCFLQRLRPPARERCYGGSGMLFIALSPLIPPFMGVKTHFSEVDLQDAGPAHFSFGAGRHGLPRRSTEFVTRWGKLFRWLTRCVVFTSQRLGTLYRSVVSSQAPFRVVPLKEICIAAGCSFLSGFITWILTWLLVPGSCPFGPAIEAIWFIIGPDTSAQINAALIK